MRRLTLTLLVLVSFAAFGPGGSLAGEASRCSLWVDVYSGEPVLYEEVLEDLATVRIVYLGERHTLDRHHDLQEEIVSGLVALGKEVALGLEMLPADLQPLVDRYNSGEITFEELAEEAGWKDIWGNYEDYRGPIEAAHRAGAPIVALNARRELAREVARKGLDSLTGEWLEKLPARIDTDQPAYRNDLLRVMMVMAHATGEDDMMQRMFEAQVVKDETMAEAAAGFMESPEGDGRTMIVLAGSGHLAHGYGVPSRVRARIPDVTDRIVIFSESGDVELSPREKAMARAIEITHARLRENTVPIADYLHLVSPAPEDGTHPEAGLE
jgi:uncharacterized iron-regulated protein